MSKQQANAVHALHEVVLPVLISLLVASPYHVLLCEQLLIGVVLLPLLLLSLLRYPGFFLLL